MIVSNSALDMRSVVVHVLSEALNRCVCVYESVCMCVRIDVTCILFVCIYISNSRTLSIPAFTLIPFHLLSRRALYVQT